MQTTLAKGLTVLLLLLCSPLLRAELKLSICYENHLQPPYTLGTDKVPVNKAGIWVDLTRAALKGAGVEPELYRSSWLRCIADVKAGRADATFAMIWTDERDSWVRFPKNELGDLRTENHLWQETYLIFIPTGGQLDWDGSKLDQVSFGVGAPRGYIAYQLLEKMDALAPLTLEPDKGLQLTARGRMDGYAVDQATGYLLVKKLQLADRISTLPIPLLRSYSYLVFSNRYYQANPAVAEKIWTSLQRVRTQKIDKLLELYEATP